MNKKTLIISAAPHSSSFTHKIVKSCVKGLEKKGQKMGDDFEIMDLYDEKFSQKFLKFESIKDMPKDKIKDLIQEKMTKADEYIFVFPIWWGGPPAIMKNFFDTNLTSGFAFQFGKNGMEKLLSNKTARVFCTSDAPGFVYKFPFVLGISLKLFFKNAILGYCGVKIKEFNLLGSMRGKDEEKRSKILEKIEKNI